VTDGGEPDATGLAGETSTGVEPRLSAILSYTAWWVSGLVFLIIEQQHRTVRFHAAQSLVLFGGLSVLIGLLSIASVGMLVVSTSAFQAARLLVYLVWIAAVGLWLLLMYRTYRGDTWRVPFVGDLAERIAAK
jgi:uncharacterized membrane protein